MSAAFESLPISLKTLLIREVALAIARQQLTDAVPLAQTREREVRATRPPFMAILPTKASQQFRAHLETSLQTLEVLQKALERLTALHYKLHALVAYRLETHLRRTAQDYVVGLAGYRYPDDWLRIKTRLEDCIRTYHESLKSLAVLSMSIPPGKTIETHPPCQQMAARATTWGERLQDEVIFINKIADVQRATTGPGGFTLKRQTPVNWKDAVRDLFPLNAQTGPGAVHDLINQSEYVTKRIMADVTSEQQLVHHHPDHGTAHYHAEQWTVLRNAAHATLNPADLDALTRETETLLENGEVEAWSFQDEQPITVTPPPAPAAPSSVSQSPFSAAPSPTPAVPAGASAPPPARRPLTLRLPSRMVTQAPFPPPTT